MSVNCKCMLCDWQRKYWRVEIVIVHSFSRIFRCSLCRTNTCTHTYTCWLCVHGRFFIIFIFLFLVCSNWSYLSREYLLFVLVTINEFKFRQCVFAIVRQFCVDRKFFAHQLNQRHVVCYITYFCGASIKLNTCSVFTKAGFIFEICFSSNWKEEKKKNEMMISWF